MSNPMITREQMPTAFPTQGGESKPSHKSVAQEVLGFTQALVELSEKVRIEANEKKRTIDESFFLPFLEEMRCKLKCINFNLNLLSDLLSQIEL